MSGDTTTTLAQLIRTLYLPNAVNTVFRNNQLVNLVPPETPPAGTTINWNVQVTGTDAAESYSEGDPMPSPNSQTHLTASVTKVDYQASAQVTGKAVASLRGSGDPVQDAINNAVANMLDLMTTTELARLEAVIDSTGIAQGINKSTYSGWASGENSSSTALTLAHMEDAVETLLAADVAADISQLEIWMPYNQLTNYSRLITGATNFPFNMSRARFDGGRLIDDNGNYPTFNGIPIIPVYDMTTTTILFLQRNLVHLWEDRPIQVVEKSTQQDAQLFLATCGYTITYDNPQKAYKLSSKTA